MIFQRQKILMYKEFNKCSEDELIDFLYELLFNMVNYSKYSDVSPIYECKNNKNTEKFIWNKECFKEYVKKNRTLVQGNIIGYTLSFFSDLNEDKSSSIIISISCTEKFYSVLDVSISYDTCTALYSNKELAKKIESVFMGLISLFDPFYACIKNTKNINGKMFKEDAVTPAHIHWINYFGSRKYPNFSINRSFDIDKRNFYKGYLLSLGVFPVNAEDSTIFELQKSIYESITF